MCAPRTRHDDNGGPFSTAAENKERAAAARPYGYFSEEDYAVSSGKNLFRGGSCLLTWSFSVGHVGGSAR